MPSTSDELPETGGEEDAQVACAISAPVVTSDDMAGYAENREGDAQVVLAMLRKLVGIGAGHWALDEDQRCAGSCAQIGGVCGWDNRSDKGAQVRCACLGDDYLLVR